MIEFNEKFNIIPKYFTISNEQQVKEFIKEHENTLDFIIAMKDLIGRYFPNYEKNIEFCKDPEFNDLDFLMIYIHSVSFDRDYEKLSLMKKEQSYLSKFSKNINGLVCVELW